MLREEVAAGWRLNSLAFGKRRRTDGAPLQFVLDLITLCYTCHTFAQNVLSVCVHKHTSFTATHTHTHTQSHSRQTHVTAKYSTGETLRAQPSFVLEVVLIQGTSSVYWHCTNLWFIWRFWQKHRHIISEYILEVIGGIVNNIRDISLEGSSNTTNVLSSYVPDNF
jgi:hypothetical protein